MFTVRETKLGPQDTAHPDVIVLIPHGRDGDTFLAEHPEVTTLFRPDMHDRQRREYLHLECDFGSCEVGYQTAELLNIKLGGRKSISILDVGLPLGVIDVLELDTEKAVRKVFEPANRSEAIARLQPLHADAIACIERAVQGLTTDGLVFVTHSMSPYNRVLAVDEDTEEPACYIRSYCDENNRGPERYVDLVTGLRGNDSKLADLTLVKALQAELSEREIHHMENEPFPLLPGTLQERIMRQCAAAALDIPKHLVAKGSLEQVASNLTRLEVDEYKVNRLADCFSDALKKALIKKEEMPEWP